MKKLPKFALAALAFAPLAAGPLASPAAADSITGGVVTGQVTITFPDVTFASTGCQDAVGSATVATDNDYAFVDWDAEATYSGPTTWAATDSKSGVYSSTFPITFTICPAFDQPGTYTALLDVTFYDDYYNPIGWGHAADTFRVNAHPVVVTPPPAPAPPAASRLTYAKSKSGRHAWKISPALTRSNRAYAGQRVVLQRQYGGAWRDTSKACYTQANGHCTVKFTQRSKKNNRAWYRLTYKGNSATRATASGRFHITKR